ncbi:MAG: hypothetical protein QNK19_11715 [Xanthomonadales bacterium]|nr:hypothetical protein [Xanthomonadales bacterium]
MVGNKLPDSAILICYRIGCTNVKAVVNWSFQVAGLLTDLPVQFIVYQDTVILAEINDVAIRVVTEIVSLFRCLSCPWHFDLIQHRSVVNLPLNIAIRRAGMLVSR